MFLDLNKSFLHPYISLFILELGFKFEERVLINLTLNSLISDSGFISAVSNLKNSFSSRHINIIAILRVSSNNKFFRTLRAFHSELINLSRVKVIHPSFNGVKPNSFCNHILASLTSNMKWSLISNFGPSYSLSFNNIKGFLLS